MQDGSQLLGLIFHFFNEAVSCFDFVEATQLKFSDRVLSSGTNFLQDCIYFELEPG